MAATIFKNHTFCFSGTLSLKRNEFEALVKKHGGACGAGVTKKTTILVTTESEIETQTAKVVKAQELSDTCSIVSEDFVNDSVKKKKLQDPNKYSLVSEKAEAAPVATSSTSKKKKAANKDVFEGLCFCFSGKLSQPRSALDALVASHGATSGDGVTKKTTHLVTTQEDFNSKTAKIAKALTMSSCVVVNEEFINDSISKKKLQDTSKYTFEERENEDEDEDEEEEVTPSTGKGKKRAAESMMEKSSPKWIVKGASAMFGIFVDDNLCICGDEAGWLLDVDHETGAIKNKVKLPTGVKAIVRDRGGFLYAGCNDGSVFDCTNLAAPRLMRAPQKEKNEIQWADIYDGNLMINQESAGCSLLNIEGETIWKSGSNSWGCAWTVRNDGKHVYCSSNSQLLALDFGTGKTIWQKHVDSHITFGVLYEDTMYLSGNGISGVPTDATKPVVKYQGSCFSSCAVSEEFVFGGTSEIVIYDRKTSKIVKTLSRSNGIIMSMQVYKNYIYAVSTNGTFECIAIDNTSFKTKQVTFKPDNSAAAIQIISAESIEVASEAKPGEVVCECVKEGGKLRIRPVTAGYNKDWNVQFPTNLRVAGAKYVVDELLEAANGGYYRAKGNIKKLA